MMYVLYRDGKPYKEFSTKEQCAAEALVRGWCTVETHGLVFDKGVWIEQRKVQ